MTDLTKLADDLAAWPPLLRVDFTNGGPETSELDRIQVIMCKADRDRIVEALRLVAQQDGAWQPIETAPLDQYVLVAHEGVVSEARYNLEDRNWWMACTGPYDFDASSPIYPTHWCPLPAPPAT